MAKVWGDGLKSRCNPWVLGRRQGAGRYGSQKATELALWFSEPANTELERWGAGSQGQ